MPDPDLAMQLAQTALDQLIDEGELDRTWSVRAEFSVPNQSYVALFRQLDPATQAETAEFSVDFDPAADGAVEKIKDQAYEWAEMSGGR
jgi:hypothetical protein